ncbi:hypothetical protein GOODEAATRI_012786 [Goodea atripinnis]|uniref:Major facilitator superfamily (MFS) profile domain-containing protein n=1 Tax=Goodea atripinnis TaxID=208336 RepID=A0ABV0N170_9TELE
MGTDQAAWFGSIYTLGAAAGGLGAMLLNDLIGRKMSIMMSAVPSSIGRLLSLGQEQKAEKALRWLRGSNYNTNIELNAIQMTGITPVLVYLEPIFAKSNVALEPRYDAAIVGAVRLFSVAVAASLMDKAGRKVLLYSSSMLMFLSSLTLTMISHTTPCPAVNITAPGYSSHAELGNTLQASQGTAVSVIPLISTVVFIFGYAMGWGPITWLLMSEVLPLVARGVASGLCVTVSWLTAFVLTHVFTLMVDTYGLYVPYLMFTVVCVLCLLFNAVCIPETRNRSLEEIENYFRTGRTFTIRQNHPGVVSS